MSEWKIIVTDMPGRHLGRVGSYLSASFSPRFDDVGAWAMAIPKGTPGADLIKVGRCIIAYLDDVVVCQGPIVNIDRHQNDSHPQPVYFVSGVTDEIHLQNRIMWVQPSLGPTNQGGIASAGYVSSPVSYILEAIVVDQMGDTAYAPRRMANFTDPVPNFAGGFGGPVAIEYRFDNLLTVMRSLGITYGVGFRMTRSGDTINGGYGFETYQPTNRATTVQFSEERGNLGDSKYSLGIPQATAVLVGGEGPDSPSTPRPFVEVVDSAAEAAWGMRIEYFDDRRDTNVTATLTAEGQATLTDKSSAVALSAQLFDGLLNNGVSTTKFGVNYFLGDIVRVYIDGIPIDDRVTQVTYSLEENGASHTVTPVVGAWEDESNNLKIFKAVKDIARRVGLLERRY